VKIKKVFFIIFIPVLIFFSFVDAVYSQTAEKQGGHGEEEFLISWRRYYNYEEMTDILKKLENKYSHLCNLYSTGQSIQNRELWLMEIGNPKTGELNKKPALYIDGNIHGNEVNGMMVPLYTIWYLLTRYGNDKYVTNLVDTRTFYIKPSVNPDAMNSFITEPNTMHHPRWNFRPVDNDGDGLFDEDPEEDINGDGEISYMRRKDPQGRWKIGEDPRIFKRVGPDDPPGGWEFIGTEGIDNDGDGKINEDIPGGVDLARNFPAEWSFSVKTGHPYPLSEPETKAVVDFFMEHKNIGGVVHYHNMGKLIMMRIGEYERPQTPPETEGMTKIEKLMSYFRSLRIPRERRYDHRNLATIAERGAQLLGYRATPLGGVGQFGCWAYEHFGVYTFLIELWNIPADYDDDGRVSREEQLRWIDTELNGEGFVEWKPFDHPQLGKIEIGGNFKKFFRRTPPGRYLAEHCNNNCLFSLYVAEKLPVMTIENIEITPVDVSEGEFSVNVKKKEMEASFSVDSKKSDSNYLVWLEVTVHNKGFMPTATQQAKNVKVNQADKIKIILPDNIKLLKDNKEEKIEFYDDLKTNLKTADVLGKTEVEIGNLNSFESKKVRWLLNISENRNSNIKIIAASQKGGTVSKKIELQIER